MSTLPGLVHDMEAGPGPRELVGSDDGGGVLVARRLQVVVVVEETGVRQAPDNAGVEVSTGGPGAAAEKTALGVASTAAVELTNLFFLLRGDSAERQCGWVEGAAVLFAFAALLSAAGLVLVRRAGEQERPAGSASRRRWALLVASAGALFVASAATVLSLLNKAPGPRGTL